MTTIIHDLAVIADTLTIEKLGEPFIELVKEALQLDRRSIDVMEVKLELEKQALALRERELRIEELKESRLQKKAGLL